MHWKTFLINLDHSTERFEQSKTQLEKLNIEFERLSAVWGTALDKSTIDSVYDSTSENTYYKKLNSGEVACYPSRI